jgi:hypothetical protein
MAGRHPAARAAVSGAALLLLAVLAACSGQRSRDFDAEGERYRAALIAAGDADSLAVAALLTSHSQPAGRNERLALAARAAAAAPRRPELAWLELQFCIQVDSCDVEAPEVRLRALDPGNGAAWSGSVTRATGISADGEAAQLRASLAAVAAANRFDIYWNPTIVMTARALQRAGMTKDRDAITLALGIGAAQPIPALAEIAHACKEGGVLAHGADAAVCRGLASVLRQGDTMIIESLGCAIALRAWPAATDEYRQAAAERRVQSYRLRVEMELSERQPSGEYLDRYLELLATHRTEQEALLAELVAMGGNPDPPAGWTEPAS